MKAFLSDVDNSRCLFDDSIASLLAIDEAKRILAETEKGFTSNREDSMEFWRYRRGYSRILAEALAAFVAD